LIHLNINWKKTFLVLFDAVIAAYLVMAITSWNKPMEQSHLCTKVNISIADENENGFLNSTEVKRLLESNGLYPLSKDISSINTRKIEQSLTQMPFVNTAQCYATNDGYVCITVTQRTPIIRVKSHNGDDYYIDDNGGIMPNSQYTSDMIIATGAITRHYATKYLSLLARHVNDSELWSRQVEQINVLPDKTVEIVPRVGDHIVNIGALPTDANPRKRAQKVEEYLSRQLTRLETFYREGLKYAGWTKYDYISLEFINQVVCHKRKESTMTPAPVPPAPVAPAPAPPEGSETGTATTTPAPPTTGNPG